MAVVAFGSTGLDEAIDSACLDLPKRSEALHVHAGCRHQGFVAVSRAAVLAEPLDKQANGLVLFGRAYNGRHGAT